jgi:hypothetical protein
MHIQTSKTKKHGTHGSYSKGCRCEPCTVAHREYTRNRLRVHRRAKQGIGPAPEPQFIPADDARNHLRYLKKKGFGTSAVAKQSGVSRNILLDIRSGKQKTCARKTERRIMNVRADMFLPNHYVDSTYANMLLEEMKDAGYSLAEINKFLGNKFPGQKVITGDSIRYWKMKKIEKLHLSLLRRPLLDEKPRIKRKGQIFP